MIHHLVSCYNTKVCYSILLILTFVSSNVYKVQAQYLWPSNLSAIESIASEYSSDKIYILLGTSNTIYSISKGTVRLVRDSNEFEQLPGIIELLTDDNILITYLYVDPYVVMGTKVSAGDILGSVDTNTLYISMYDIPNNRYIDPLYVLPNINRNIAIKLLAASFEYQNPEEIQVLSKRIRSGGATLVVNIQIYDSESTGMLMPETIWVNIGANEYVLTKDVLQQQIYESVQPDAQRNNTANTRNIDQVNKSNAFNNYTNMEFVLSNVEIARGYQDIIITIHTVLGKSRTLRFNVFAN